MLDRSESSIIERTDLFDASGQNKKERKAVSKPGSEQWKAKNRHTEVEAGTTHSFEDTIIINIDTASVSYVIVPVTRIIHF